MQTATIRVAQPCQENWAVMTPTAAGRHCAACASEVIDFTLKTDAEILAHLAKAAGSRMCGRFAAGQLERPLQRAVPATPTARWRAWLAAAVAVWGLRESVSLESKAQAPMEMRKMDKVVPANLRATAKPDYEGLAPELMFRGRVCEASTHEAIPGATVTIKGTTIGASTNADGNFELCIPSELSGKMVTVVCNSLGYMTVEQLVQIGPESQIITLPLNSLVLGGMEVVAYVRPLPPAPWHPRRFYNWSKYWVMRPFRSW